jgi:hypothetical protein
MAYCLARLRFAVASNYWKYLIGALHQESHQSLSPLMKFSTFCNHNQIILAIRFSSKLCQRQNDELWAMDRLEVIQLFIYNKFLFLCHAGGFSNTCNTNLHHNRFICLCPSAPMPERIFEMCCIDKDGNKRPIIWEKFGPIVLIIWLLIKIIVLSIQPLFLSKNRL